MALISIIIPCYNVEEYIDRCLNSLVTQTIGLKNLELICVNDASADGTLEKLQEWEKRYPENIMVITYEVNQRQGGARNIGLQYATADLIGFMDSDDWAEPDMYRDLYEKMSAGKYDTAACKYIHDPGDGSVDTVCREQRDQEYIFADNGGYYWSVPEYTGINGQWGGITTHLYKRETIVKSGIDFPVGVAYEDNYWINIINLYIGSLYIIDRPYYHYFTNMNSTVTGRNSVHQLDRLKIEPMLMEKYIELGVFGTFYGYIFYDFMQRYYLNTWGILFTRFDEIPDIYTEMHDTVMHYFPQWMEQYPIEDEKEPRKMLLEFLKNNAACTEKQLLELKIQYLTSLK